ncbi:MAG TPA: hypothetical protein VGI93_19390 [Steroidobacteraceae bacterium]
MAPLERLLRLYLATFSALIVLASAKTFVSALHGTEEHEGQTLLLVISGLEILAALGFLLPRTRSVSGLVLAFLFILAALIHGLHARDVPVALLVYLATTLFLLKATHRPKSLACA